MDEPTDGLDPNQKHEVRNLIRRMGEKKAIIFSTHILEEVEAVCTRAIIIDRGSIVASGTPAELKGRAEGAGVLSLRVGGTDRGHRQKARGFARSNGRPRSSRRAVPPASTSASIPGQGRQRRTAWRRWPTWWRGSTGGRGTACGGRPVRRGLPQHHHAGHPGAGR
jgi:ABC-type multidrug transport system ATPase subunit